MAISTYAELQSSVASWLNRTDLTAQIPDFIALAESRLNRKLKLRMTETEASLSVASAAQSVALPAGFVAPMGLWVVESGTRRELRYLDPTQMHTNGSAGTIQYWTITGANIVFERPASDALSLILRYTASLALSDASDTNWLLTNYPDAYLFAALVEASDFVRDTEGLAKYSARLEGALAEVNDVAARSRSMTTLSTDPALMQRGARPDMSIGSANPAAAFDFAAYYEGL